MTDNAINILSNVANYYGNRINEFGATPRGVDWNGEDGQNIRFQQLLKVITESSYSINDIGCGYGALAEFLLQSNSSVDYIGVDVSEEMIIAAQAYYKDHESQRNVRFVLGDRPNEKADYSVASGIFNVKLDHDEQSWLNYILATIEVMDQFSDKGFSFNCLTSYSDQDRKEDKLYYCDPCFIFDFCKKRYSKNVTLLHDYDLYEFTIIVRK